MYFLTTLLSGRNRISSLFHLSLIRSSLPRPSPSIRTYCDKGKILDDETIRLLEKLSLVNFENDKYISVVEDAIKFADNIDTINTDNVEPLITVLEDRALRLRDDVVTDGNCQKKILSNAKVLEEDYFVAPPGNIPISSTKNSS